MQLSKRLTDLKNYAGIKQWYKLADKVGVSRQTISRMANDQKVEHTKLETIVAILKAFPEINPEWFVLGKGKMFKDKSLSSSLYANEPQEAYNFKLSDKTEEYLREEVTWLRKIIEENLKVDIEEAEAEQKNKTQQTHKTQRR